MTQKIFFDSLDGAYILEFHSLVKSIEPYEDNYAVILEKTAFYPESGGQPSDRGTIDGIAVLDVIQKNEEILHILSQKPANREILGKVDFDTRLDHTQQHTGQHLISACFIKLFNAETNSFHIGTHSTTIEIKLSDFNQEMADSIEDLANDMIYKNVPVTARVYDDGELKKLPLRKQPKVRENIRVVQIMDFDYSPCGGTHVAATGELGMIKIKKWEKCKDWHRIEFVCGKRALLDYRMKNTAINNIGAMLSLRDFEVETGVEKLLTQMQELQKQMSETEKSLNKYLSDELLKDSIEINGVSVIKKIFTDKDANQIKFIAQNIIDNSSYVVLFASIGEKTQILFSRSDDVSYDMGKLLKANMDIIDGKGGGGPKSAQGGGNRPEMLEEFFDKVIEDMKK